LKKKNNKKEKYLMSLKEQTWDLHKLAETATFSKKLLKGLASKEEYANYLYNLLAIYDPIEWSARRQGMFDNLQGLARLKALHDDFCELDSGEYYQLVPSVVEYHDYLVKLGNDPLRRHLIKAHLYCRHMGDLNGGQFIKKIVAVYSKGTFYDFENADNLKTAIQKELTDDLGAEARVAFIYAIRMMRELGGE
jgi:heme oxygenase